MYQMPCLSFKVSFHVKFFGGNVRIYIWRKVSEKGIQKEIDFILRHPQTRERTFVFVSEGKAKEILKFQCLFRTYSAKVLREMSALQIGMQVTIQDIDEMLTGETQAAAIPYIKIKTSKNRRKIY